MSYYKISDDAKLHVVISKGVKRENPVQPPSEIARQQPTAPKYQPDDFWNKLEEILLKQYDTNTVQKIIQQFRTVGQQVN